jgi:hypothetical protein
MTILKGLPLKAPTVAAQMIWYAAPIAARNKKLSLREVDSLSTLSPKTIVPPATAQLFSEFPINRHWTKSLRDSLELAELVMLRGMR